MRQVGQKRAITAVQAIGDLGDATRVALVVGVIHGDEPAGLRIVQGGQAEAPRRPSSARNSG